MGSARWHNCAELRAANGATILIRHGAAATEPFGLPSKLGDLVNPKRNGILTALCYRQPQLNHKMTKHTLTIFLLILSMAALGLAQSIFPSKQASIWIERTAASNLTRGGRASPAS